MPYQPFFASPTIANTSDGGNSYTSFFGFDVAPNPNVKAARAAQQTAFQNERQQLQQQQAAKGIKNPSSLINLQAQLHNKQITPQQFTQQFAKAAGNAKGVAQAQPFKVTPGVVASSALQAGKGLALPLAKGLVQSEQTAATGIARVLPGGTADIQANTKSVNQADQAVKQAIADRKAGKISPITAAKIIQSSAKTAGQASAQQAATVKAMPSKGQLAAGFGGVAADIATGGTLPELKTAGTVAKVIKGGTQAGAFGVDSALNAASGGGNKKQIAENAVAGAAFPLALHGAGLVAKGIAKVGSQGRDVVNAGVGKAPAVSTMDKVNSLPTDRTSPPSTATPLKTPNSNLTPLSAADIAGKGSAKSTPVSAPVNNEINNTTSKGLGESGAVAPGQAVKDVQAMIDKHNQVTQATSNIQKGLDVNTGIQKDIKLDSASVLKNRAPISNADKQTLQDYRDAKAAGMTPQELPAHLQAEDAHVTALNTASQKADAEVARLSGNLQKAKTIEARNPETYTHRIAQDKGSSIDYLLQGNRNNPMSVGGLSKTTAGSKSRQLMALTDEQGNRKVVSITNTTAKNPLGQKVAQNQVVTHLDNGGKTQAVLGRIQKVSDQKKVTEFNDKTVMDGLNKLANDLGIKHERIVSNRGAYAGKSITGANKIITKAASPERTLLHEIGHQIDEKYKLQEKFVNNPATKKELRNLTDLRTGGTATKSFSKYVRKGEEKIATMFEAYLHTPDKFKEIAPNAYKQFDQFLKSNPETKPITEIKPSLVLGKNVVKSGPDRIPGEFIGKDGTKYKIGQATQSEITKATGQKYYTDPKLTSVINYADSRTALENTRFVESIKKILENKNLAVQEGETAPKGFQSTSNLYFRGYKFDPKVAEVLNDAAFKSKDDLDLLNNTGRVLRQTIVYVPIKHDLNEGAFYAIDRGLSSLVNPAAYARMGISLGQAARDVIKQEGVYKQMLRSGSHMMTADDKQLGKIISKQLKGVTSTDQRIVNFAKGAGTSPVKLYKALQKVTVWGIQDILNVARVRERMMPTALSTVGVTKKLSFEQALAKTERYGLQYKVPSRAALPGKVGRSVSNTLRSPKVFFGSYTYDKYRITKNIVKDTANLRHPVQAAQAADKLAAMVFGAAIAWPLVEKGVQNITGDKAAHVTAPGPLAIPQTVIKVAKGQQNPVTAAKGQISLGTPLTAGMDTLSGRNSFTGKLFRDPNAPLATQAKQTGQYLESLLAPVQKATASKNATRNKTLSTVLSMTGASLPKNTPEATKLYSLQYDSLPMITAQAKAQAQKGDFKGAAQTIANYDKAVMAAAQADAKSKGVAVPSAEALKKANIFYQPKQSTIQSWLKPKKAKAGAYTP